MKKVAVYASVFALAFIFGIGIVFIGSSPADAKPPYNPPLPCNPDNIYCTSIPCSGTYHSGGIFYCYPDFETEYCSGDWYYPVPCSHIM